MVDRSIFYPDPAGMAKKFQTMIRETPFGPRSTEIERAVLDLDTAAKAVGDLTETVRGALLNHLEHELATSSYRRLARESKRSDGRPVA